MKAVSEKKGKQSTGLYVKDRYYVLIVLIILILPYLYRFNNIAPGDENYLIKRISLSIIDNWNLYDELSFGGRAVTYPLGSIIIFMIFSKFNDFFLVLIPILLGILTILLYIKILRKFKIDNTVILTTILILVLSNAFLYNFTVFNFFTIPVFLFLLAFYFFINERYFLSIILFSLIPFFGFFNFIVSFFLILFFLLYKREFRKFLIYFLLVLATSFAAFFWQIKNFGFPNYNIDGFAISLQNIITEFNGFGISLFVFLLSLIGLKKLWEKKYEYLMIYVSLIFLFLLVFVNSRLIVYLDFFLSFLAALGLINIFKSKWELKIIKNIMIIVLTAGIIFSGFSYIVKFNEIMPTTEMNEGLIYLKEISQDNEVVFSHFKNGIYINSIANRKNFIDKNFLYITDVKQRLRDNNELLYSRNLKKTEFLLKKYDIKYIIVTNDMKNGLVWNDDNDGLLFVMKFSENFLKVYGNNEMEIWKYLE